MRKRFRSSISLVGTADGKVLHRSEVTKAEIAIYKGKASKEQKTLVCEVRYIIRKQKELKAAEELHLLRETAWRIEDIMGWGDLSDDVFNHLMDTMISNHKHAVFYIRRTQESDLAALREISYYSPESIWLALFIKDRFTFGNSYYHQSALALRGRIEASLRRGVLFNKESFGL